MRSKSPWWLAAALLLTACSSTVDPAPPVSPGTSTGVSAILTPTPATPPVPPTPSPPTPTVIHLAALPEQGVAVERDGEVDFYGFVAGKLRARLPGFRIFDSTGAPGSLVLQRGGVFYRLVDYRSLLRPLASRRAAERAIDPDSPHLDLPIPESRGKRMVGHWRFEASDPRRYDRVLAQWSGECEVPIAFFVDRDEGAPIPVTGEEDPADAPESLALGWNKLGQAVVLLPEGECGGTADPPGVYLFRQPGRGRLLVRTGRHAAARMWGTTVAD
jgi:hypothetical protein